LRITQIQSQHEPEVLAIQTLQRKFDKKRAFLKKGFEACYRGSQEIKHEEESPFIKCGGMGLDEAVNPTPRSKKRKSLNESNV